MDVFWVKMVCIERLLSGSNFVPGCTCVLPPGSINLKPIPHNTCIYYYYYYYYYILLLLFLLLSADPGLGQGRGGAWDHRRCGTSPSSLSTVKPILQPSSHINSFCLLPTLKTPNLPLQPTGTPGPHINGFLWASKSTVWPP